MTRDDIIRMALEAGMEPYDMSSDWSVKQSELECFAALAFAAGAKSEREACVKVCVNMGGMAGDYADEFATAIRARGSNAA